MDATEYFAKRHTIRSYTKQGISDDLLRQIISDASHAPNTGNMQWYSVIVTRDEARKAALAPAHFNQPSVTSANVVLTFCIDLLRFEAWCRQREAVPGYDNFQSFIAAIVDTTIFAQQVCTIAELHGLGSCYLGTTTYNAPDIARALGLPDRVVPVTTLTLGYPAEGTQAGPTWRMPVEAIMHDETYREPAPSDIDRWYAPIEETDAHFAVENGKKTLAQVFTDIRYTREASEHFSKVYADFLRKNRFVQ